VQVVQQAALDPPERLADLRQPSLHSLLERSLNMGQYHLIVNLDKGEYIHPHKLGDGLKWGEQASSELGIMTALWGAITCPEPRGGGDPNAHPWVGRWYGDRVVMVGDYAEDKDRPDVPQWGALYHRCTDSFAEWVEGERARLVETHSYFQYRKTPERIDAVEKAGPITDMSAVARDFLKVQFGLRFSGTGWLQRTRPGSRAPRTALAPDLIIRG
jgi:hypothetical protein